MQCRVCDSTALELAIDLGNQPWCNHFLTEDEIGKEPFYQLRVVFCLNCHVSQLDYTVPKETMFSNHTYLSGITKALSDHFKSVAHEVDNRFFKDRRDKSVLDIGSNDGTQLQHYKALKYDVLGVESSRRTAEIANANGIETLNDFFNLEVAKNIGQKFSIINAAGVFFHLEELHSAAEGIRESLEEEGVFVVQFLYMKKIIENMAFDQIYHEHLLYYNLETVETLLNMHGMEMFDAYLSPIHGGSIIGLISHRNRMEPTKRLIDMRRVEHEEEWNSLKTYLKFAERIDEMKTDNLSYLNQAKRNGKRIYGFGAPVKGNTLLNYFDIGTDYLDCLVEKNELRRGLYSPGKHIPIVMENELEGLPDIYYVLAWNFKREILANNQHLIQKGIDFHFPVNI